MKKYVLGVDGGGTKTDYLLYDTEGNKIAQMQGKATNHEALAGGMAELEVLLKSVLPPFLMLNGINPGELAGSVFGMAGVDIPGQKKEIEAMLSKIGFKNFLVMNDSFIGIKAGSTKGYGICAVNGTGNTVSGIDPHGRRLQVAGAGWISGEDGGAGRIAETVFRAVYEECFCLGRHTAMKARVMEIMEIEDPVYLIEAVRKKYFTGIVKSRDILEILFETGNQGDTVAIEIMENIGRQIARCIAGCEKTLDFGEDIEVVLVGSVMLKASSSLIVDTLKSETRRLTGKNISFIHLTVPPAVGSVLWAVELALGKKANKEIADKIAASLSAEDG